MWAKVWQRESLGVHREEDLGTPNASLFSSSRQPGPHRGAGAVEGAGLVRTCQEGREGSRRGRQGRRERWGATGEVGCHGGCLHY